MIWEKFLGYVLNIPENHADKLRNSNAPIWWIKIFAFKLFVKKKYFILFYDKIFPFLLKVMRIFLKLVHLTFFCYFIAIILSKYFSSSALFIINFYLIFQFSNILQLIAFSFQSFSYHLISLHITSTSLVLLVIVILFN